MKVKAFEIYNAQNIDGMEWEDILQIIPMGNKAIVLVKDKEERRNDPPQGKKRAVDPLMEEYEQEFNKRCKEALYDDFVGGTEKIKFDYLNSDTSDIEKVVIFFNMEDGSREFILLDLTKRPETYKYITFSSEEDENGLH